MMPAFLVAIPSYKRSGVVVQKTLRLCLEELAIPPSHIYLFLVQEDPEHDRYLEGIPQGLQVRYGPVGLHNMRNEMGRFFGEMARVHGHPIHVLYLDDDLDHFVRMVIRPEKPDKTASRYALERMPPQDMITAVAGAFACLEDRGLDLFGFYPVANGYFMKDLAEVTYDLRFCVGAAYGMIHRPNAPGYELELEEKEDFERTLLSYERHGGVVRLNRIAPITTYYKRAGGLQSRGYDRKEAAQRSCESLLARFPLLCRPYHGKKTGMPEVRLVHPKKKALV